MPLEPLVPRPRPIEARCTDDGAACIGPATYTADVCRTIEAAARANALDPGFFARLLWKESLFDAAAVSPAGAEGIAQFMPDTAKLRGLADAFNPAEALYASARYLAELTRDYGNIGLAAAAYNGGEARAHASSPPRTRLPPETRAYVSAITGFPAETWRDAPPASVDLALDQTAAFQSACIAYATTAAAAGSARCRAAALGRGARLEPRPRRPGAPGRAAAEPPRRDPAGRAAATRRQAAGHAARAPVRADRPASRAEAEALCARLRWTAATAWCAATDRRPYPWEPPPTRDVRCGTKAKEPP